jgi:hypothetical protein
MSTLQAFWIGVMVSWTPSLIFLACQLWRVAEFDEDSSSAFDA